MSTNSHDKLIDQIGSMTVLQLAELVKALEEKFGVSAAPVAVAGAAPVAAAATAKAEEKSEYKVTLKAVKDAANQINVIKALRQVTTLGIAEAKKAVVEAPTVIAEAASKDDAKKMKELLEAAGAEVELS